MGIKEFKQKINNAVTSTMRTLPKDALLAQFTNEMKKRQIEWTAKGSPITEAEMAEGVTDDWKGTGFLYRRAGVTLEDLIEAGKLAIADTSGVTELPKIAQSIADHVGRNASCPCGSGKKFKKCCGKT